MSQPRLWRYLAAVAVLAAIYFVTGKIVFSIPSISTGATPLFPPAGISQAALFLFGRGIWPGVALGDFFISLKVGHPWYMALGMAFIPSLQAIAGATLLRRLGLHPSLESLRDVLALVALSALLSTIIGPTLAVTILCGSGFETWSKFAGIWWTWWIGDAMGVLILAPVVLTWFRGEQRRMRSRWHQITLQPRRVIEAVVLCLMLLGISWAVFGSSTKIVSDRYPIEYLPLPLVIWAAFRFGQRGTVLASLFVSSIAIWGASKGSGPFIGQTDNINQAILALQTFMGVEAITALVLGATVTERKQAEISLRQSEASLANAQRIAHLGSWDLDLVRQQLHWSDEHYRILGFSPKAFEPTVEIFLNSVHPDDQQRLKELLDAASFHNQPFSTDFRIILPDNQERIVQGSCETIQEPSGRIIRLIGTIQDISKQKRIEKALLESEAQLLELAHNLDQKVTERTLELEQKNEELARSLFLVQQTQQQLIQSEKMSSLGELVGGIAHEINNPINFIYGNILHTSNYAQNLIDVLNLYQKYYPAPEKAIQAVSETVELDFIIDDLPKVLSSMHNGAERIRQIVISLRNFSRLDESEMKPVNIHEGIDSTLLILQRRLKGRLGHPDIEVIKEYGQLPLVECYPGELNQVFLNILNNAIDALEQRMKDEAKIFINENYTNSVFTLEAYVLNISTKLLDNNRVQIKISDNGIGIEEAAINKIFDPFFTTKEVGKGTGLGLSICYQIIVEKHKGQLKCLSGSGSWTTFEINIPLRQRGQL